MIAVHRASRRALHVVERNTLAYRRMWYVFAAGVVEPMLFLFSIGVGVGHLVGRLAGPGGHLVTYEAYVAPGMMAAAAMNGSVLDSTFNFFVKYKYLGTYDTMLSTPMGVVDVAFGEVVWGFLRGAMYATAFLVTLVAAGLVSSWWAVLAIPGSLVVGYAFAGVGLASTTWMRSFIDFDYVNLAIIPLFLFSATFFPLSRYPGWLQAVVRPSPLYQGVSFERIVILGRPTAMLAVYVVYLLALGTAGIVVASRRLERLLQP